VNRKQVDFYSKTFSLNALIVDDDNILVGGPLLGLMSVHCQFPGEDLLVIACDMVNLEETALRNLVGAYHQNDFDAYVFTTIEKVQPLCGIYTSGGLKRIYDLNLQKQLKKNSMMYVLECLNTKYILADAWIDSFTNFNSFEDISIYRVS
jgi:molybdopterin-guanine dinucleotide biosynthesis protein A